MEVIILMEDSEVNNNLLYEHGFSVYIKTKHNQMLIDTGASDKTWINAKQLGVDLASIDKVFLSHGHYDHSGGMIGFLKENANARIYMHPKAGLDYYNLRDGQEKYIGIDKSILDLPNLIYLSKEEQIDQEISVFGNVTGRRNWPQSNLILKQKVDGEFIQDRFEHEQYGIL